MFKIFEYTKDNRGNFVTKAKDAPYKWFMVSRPRSSGLIKKDIVLCLETFEKGNRKYITGLLKLNYKSCYVGDVKDETIIVWYNNSRVQLVLFDGTKGNRVDQRKNAANKFLQNILVRK